MLILHINDLTKVKLSLNLHTHRNQPKPNATPLRCCIFASWKHEKRVLSIHGPCLINSRFVFWRVGYLVIWWFSCLVGCTVIWLLQPNNTKKASKLQKNQQNNVSDKREQRKLAYSAERRNRRTSERRAKLAWTFLSEEEEDEVKRRRSQPYNLITL